MGLGTGASDGLDLDRIVGWIDARTHLLLLVVLLLVLVLASGAAPCEGGVMPPMEGVELEGADWSHRHYQDHQEEQQPHGCSWPPSSHGGCCCCCCCCGRLQGGDCTTLLLLGAAVTDPVGLSI